MEAFLTQKYVRSAVVSSSSSDLDRLKTTRGEGVVSNENCYGLKDNTYANSGKIP